MSKKKSPPSSRRPTQSRPRRRGARWAAIALALAGLAVLAALAVRLSGTAPFPSLAPAAALTPVPWPDLARLNAGDRAAIEAQRDAVQRIESRSPRDGPALAEAYGRLGQRLLAADLAPAAAAALANAAALAPADARWPYYLGYQNAQAHRAEQAAAGFSRAVDLDPGSLPAKIHLAEAYRELKRFDEAAELLDEVLQASPDSAPAHFLLGQIAADQGRLAEAVSQWETVLRLDPAASITHRHLATAYRDLGDQATSERHLAQRGDVPVALDDPLIFELNALRSASGALITQGGEAMQSGDAARAAELYAQAVAREPDNAQARLNLGAALMQLGRKDEADLAFKEAVRLNPNDSKAQFNLGLLAQEAGRADEALAAFQAAVAADPANARAQLALGDALRLAGRCGEAGDPYARYLADNPTDSRARRRFALCLAQAGAYAEARTLLEAGHTVAPADPITTDALVRLLAAAPDDAVRDGAQAVRLAEQLGQAQASAEANEILAMAYAEVGRFDDAIRLQQQVIQAIAGDVQRAPLMAHLAANLEAYQKRQPSRTPFPAFAYSR